MKILRIIESEIANYIDGQIQISPEHYFSQYKVIKRIFLYLNKLFDTGKNDSQGKYKYFFDIITPRIEDEVKNIDFDIKDIYFSGPSDKDFTPIFLANLYLQQWLKDNDKSVNINDAIDEFSTMGNVVWKKIKGDYIKLDLKDLYVINSAAETLDNTPVIERHILTQSEMRGKKSIWDGDKVEEVIKTCSCKEFTNFKDGNADAKETPYYEIFERNGEISVADLKEAQGEYPKDGDEEKYVLAKIVTAGMHKGGNEKGRGHILYADKIPKMPYREAHRGKFKGRWLREGIVEILFDVQTRANEIGNELARGLEWAGKQVFSTPDKQVFQNLMMDLQRGDVLYAPTGIQQINVVMQGFDQLIAEWNRIVQVADRLTHSFEVVRGESMPSGTPFRLAERLNMSATKFFDRIREQFALGLRDVFNDWLLPEILTKLKKEEVLKITGEPEYLDNFYQMAVDGWYIQNLLILPPHTKEIAEMIKAQKIQELKNKKELLTKVLKDLWQDIKMRIKVVISGENLKLDNLEKYIGMETDPVRRTALIEKAMKREGIDVSKLPKTELPSQQPAPAVKVSNAPEVAGGEATI